MEPNLWLRIRAVGMKAERRYCVYRNGRYLGSEGTLEEAQALAAKGERKENAGWAPVKAEAETAAAEAALAAGQKPPPITALTEAPLAEVRAKEERAPARSSSTPTEGKIVIVKQNNACAAGSQRYQQFELARRSKTVAEFKKAKGKPRELALFIDRGWIRLEK